MAISDSKKYSSIKQKVREHTRKDGKGCHIWTLGINDSGYGIICWGGERLRAHRVAYEIWVGPIPDGCVVHHSCANKACINPKHLQTITPQENTAEMHERRHYQKRIAELEAKLGRCEREHDGK